MSEVEIVDDEDQAYYSRQLRYANPIGKAGRPATLTPKLAATIASEVRLGARPREVASAMGVPISTWYSWKNLAKEGRQPWKMLLGKIEIAEASFIALAEQRLAGEPDWRATLAILKSRRRGVYGDKVEIAATAPQPRELTHEELQAKALEMGLPEIVFQR